MISSAMYEVLPRGASPRCAPPAKRRSARKADPRRGGQGRPAPRHRRTKKSIAAAWRTRQTRAAKCRGRGCPGSATCVLYLTFYTLSSPFFWFYFPRFPRPSPSLYGFPLPFCGFFRPLLPRSGRGRTNAAGGCIYMIAGKPARKQRRTLYGRSYLFSFRHWRLRMHPLLPVGDNAGDRAARQHGPARRHRPARPRRTDRPRRSDGRDRCHGRDRAAGQTRHPRPHRPARPRRTDRPRRSDGSDGSDRCHGRDRATG